MILIDASVFLELALDQEKANDCSSFLSAVARGDMEAVVTHFAVHGVEAIIGKGTHLMEFLRNLENSHGLSIYETSISDEIAISMTTEKTGMDFDDAIQYFVAKRIGSEAIVSFDRHFDGLDIPRFEPGDVMHQVEVRADLNEKEDK
jgi:predicted nucleic acid-binding protein